MPQVYTKPSKKETSKIATHSKKEIVDKEEENFSGTSFEMEEELEEDQGQWLTHLFSRNGKLSFACRGFLAYLFSHKPGFKINLKMIQNNVFDIPYKREKGRDYIRRLAKEAEQNGYLSKSYYSLNGLRRFIYKVHKKPLIKKMFARDGITVRGNPVPLLRIPNSTDRNNTKKPTPPSSAIIFHMKIGETGLTLEEYSQLGKELGKDLLDLGLQGMNDWLDKERKANPKVRFTRKDIVKKVREWCIKISKSRKTIKLISEKHGERERQKQLDYIDKIKNNNKKLLTKVSTLGSGNKIERFFFDGHWTQFWYEKKRYSGTIDDENFTKVLEKIIEKETPDG